MKFWEAMRELQEGKKVRRMDWLPSYHLYVNEDGFITMDDCIILSFDVRDKYEWEIYDENKVIKILK